MLQASPIAARGQRYALRVCLLFLNLNLNLNLIQILHDS